MQERENLDDRKVQQAEENKVTFHEGKTVGTWIYNRLTSSEPTEPMSLQTYASYMGSPKEALLMHGIAVGVAHEAERSLEETGYYTQKQIDTKATRIADAGVKFARALLKDGIGRSRPSQPQRKLPTGS